MSRRLFGDFWLGAATRKYRWSETLICWMSAMKKTPICIFRWLMKWRNGTRKAGSLFSLSSNLTSEERPSAQSMSKRWWRPAHLVFLTVHEDADFARAALDAGRLGYVVKARLASDLLRETSRLARGQSIVITQRAHSAAPSHQSAACQPSADARRRTQSTRRPPPARPYPAVRAAPSACLAPRPEEQRW